MTATTIENKIAIFSAIHNDIFENDECQDFYNAYELSLHIAYLTATKCVVPTERGIDYINKDWNRLMSDLGISDTGFVSQEELYEHGLYEVLGR